MFNEFENKYVFSPPSRWGYLFHAGALILLLLGAAFSLYSATQAQVGPTFLLYLLPVLAIIIIAPFLSYALYALRTASYRLERDGMRLRWGLRVEEIPMNEIIWVRQASELSMKLPHPFLRLPGAILGIRLIPALARLGAGTEVEYLASTFRNLILVGTEKRVYAISPSDTNGMLYAFQRLTELGSLTPLHPRSVYPRFLLGQAWTTRPVRILMLISLGLSLALFAWISLAIPTRTQVNLGFRSDGSPGDAAPSVQLLLLPVLNGIITINNFFIGLFFFRRRESQNLAYVIWTTQALIPILFLIGVYFILHIG